MKKLFRIMLCCFILVALLSTSAFAESDLKITDKSLIAFEGESYGYFFARVENVGDKPVDVGDGKLVVFSTDDDILYTEGYIGTLPYYPVLEPGDYLYIEDFMWDNALADAEIGDCKFSISETYDAYPIAKIPCEAEFELDADDYYENYLYVTFTNPTEEPLFELYVIAAVYDADGNLTFVDYDILDTVAVHPGSTVTVRLYVDYDIVEYCVENNIAPAAVDAMVCYYK